mmetsp:Transcript_3351/g.5996  ORF Transcript_3351/g.5996 Transcript_3351/m.5996 type:complete len:85 (-) Transcript_3351:805-1059(-)
MTTSQRPPILQAMREGIRIAEGLRASVFRRPSPRSACWPVTYDNVSESIIITRCCAPLHEVCEHGAHSWIIFVMGRFSKMVQNH